MGSMDSMFLHDHMADLEILPSTVMLYFLFFIFFFFFFFFFFIFIFIFISNLAFRFGDFSILKLLSIQRFFFFFLLITIFKI